MAEDVRGEQLGPSLDDYQLRGGSLILTGASAYLWIIAAFSHDTESD